MGKFGLKLATALSSGMLIGFAAPALAQDDGAPQATSASGAGDIIVTARRSEERLQDVPISITVLDQDTITKRNIISTADLGNYVPSLSVNSQFGPEKSSFVIRGFTQEYHTAPTVGVYFADVIAPRALGPTTSGNGAGVGNMFDLENLQVLKGPQGTLFGRNTTGGAILLVPTKPKDTLEGYVEGTIGKYDTRRVEAVLNVPLADTFKVRLGIDRNKRDGYLRNHSGVGPDRFRDVDYIAARLSIVADLTPDLENYTIASYSKTDTNGDVPRMLYCNQDAANQFLQTFNPALFLPFTACAQVARQNARGDGIWDVENNNLTPRQQVNTWQIINTTTWQASDNLTIKNIVSYAEYREWADFSLWGDNLLIPEGFPGAGFLATKTITLHGGLKGPTTAQSTFTEELQIQGTAANGKLNWQAGAYLEVSKPLAWNSQLVEIFITCPDVRTNQCIPTDTGSISDASSKDWFNNKGFYAQATYDLSDQFSVTGGIRYTIDKQTDKAQLLNIVFPTSLGGQALYTCQNRLLYPGPGGPLTPLFVPDSNNCDQVFKIKSKKPTWLIGIDYKPSDDILLYAKWARGYRAGSITNNSIGFETSKPEKVDSYEVGAKTSFRGAFSGYYNVAGFYNDFQNQQLATNSVIAPEWQGIIPPAAPTVNAGKSRIWGVEVDASVRPFEGFRLDVGYTYLNTKLQSFTAPDLPIYYSSLTPATAVGGPLPLSPKNRVTITGNYTLPLDDSIGQISFGATFTHTDGHEARSPDATPAYYVVPTDHLNLNASWESILSSNFDLSFFMTNVTNEAYIVFPSSSYFTFGGDGGHVNEPRMWGVRLKYRFGE
ncbi:MAG: TonB-dependent receptor [Novosphingobium sp.]|nr:TonB-dependent receptor [Novosphingobium sp.]